MSSLKPRVIVCLDVANGRVVKGVNFTGLKDMGDPVELACQYQEQGADEIIFLDIEATPDNRRTALDSVTRVAQQLSIPFTVGGGLNSFGEVARFLDAGADKVALNSAAVKTPSLISKISGGYGSQSLVVAVDTKYINQSYQVLINGARQQTGLYLSPWLTEIQERGAGEVLLSAIDRDGTGLGFDNKLMALATKNLTIQVIASGGAATPEHFLETFKAGSDAALAAGMFHRSEYTVGQVKQVLQKNGVEVRLC